MSKLLNALSVIVPIILILLGIAIYGVYTDRINMTESIIEEGATEYTGTVTEQTRRDFFNYYYNVKYTDDIHKEYTCELATLNPKVLWGQEVQLYVRADGTVHIPMVKYDRLAYVIAACTLALVGIVLECMAFFGAKKITGNKTKGKLNNE